MAEGGESGSLRSVLAYFGVEVDDKEMVRFDEGVSGVVEHLRHAAGAIAGFFAVREIKEFFDATVEQAAQLQHMSDRLGVGTDELQKFRFAAKMSGVEAGEADHSLALLNRQIGNAAQGGGEGAQEFTRLGVQIKDSQGNIRDTSDVIFDVADAFKNITSQPERAAAAMKLFGRAGQGMLPLLQQGGDSLREVYGEFEGLGGMMSGDFLKAAKEAEEEQVKMSVTMQGLKIRIVNAALPTMIAMVRGIQKAVVAGQKLLDSTNALTHAMQFLKVMMAGVATYGLVKALFAALSPMGLMVLAIGAVYLAYDELMTFMEGGSTVLGDALDPEDAEALRKALQGVADAWPAIKDAAGVAIAVIKEGLISVYHILDGIGMGIASVIEGVKGLVTGDEDAKERAREGFRKTVVAFEAAVTPAETAGGGGTTPAVVPQEFGLPAPVRPSAVVAPAAGSVGPNSGAPVTQTIGAVNVTVQHTGGESAEKLAKITGQGVRKELDVHLSNALNAVKKS